MIADDQHTTPSSPWSFASASPLLTPLSPALSWTSVDSRERSTEAQRRRDERVSRRMEREQRLKEELAALEEAALKRRLERRLAHGDTVAARHDAGAHGDEGTGTVGLREEYRAHRNAREYRSQNISLTNTYFVPRPRSLSSPLSPGATKYPMPDTEAAVFTPSTTVRAMTSRYERLDDARHHPVPDAATAKPTKPALRRLRSDGDMVAPVKKGIRFADMEVSESEDEKEDTRQRDTQDNDPPTDNSGPPSPTPNPTPIPPTSAFDAILDSAHPSPPVRRRTLDSIVPASSVSLRPEVRRARTVPADKEDREGREELNEGFERALGKKPVVGVNTVIRESGEGEEIERVELKEEGVGVNTKEPPLKLVKPQTLQMTLPPLQTPTLNNPSPVVVPLFPMPPPRPSTFSKPALTPVSHSIPTPTPTPGPTTTTHQQSPPPPPPAPSSKVAAMIAEQERKRLEEEEARLVFARIRKVSVDISAAPTSSLSPVVASSRSTPVVSGRRESGSWRAGKAAFEEKATVPSAQTTSKVVPLVVAAKAKVILEKASRPKVSWAPQTVEVPKAIEEVEETQPVSATTDDTQHVAGIPTKPARRRRTSPHVPLAWATAPPIIGAGESSVADVKPKTAARGVGFDAALVKGLDRLMAAGPGAGRWSGTVAEKEEEEELGKETKPEEAPKLVHLTKSRPRPPRTARREA